MQLMEWSRCTVAKKWHENSDFTTHITPSAFRFNEKHDSPSNFPLRTC